MPALLDCGAADRYPLDTPGMTPTATKGRFLRSIVSPAAVLIMVSSVGCSDLSPGSRCGGNAYAHGRITLPDTGISAGARIIYSFVQRDPDLIPEQTDLSIQQTLEGFAPGGELPWIRLVKPNGELLFEQFATRDNQSLPWKVLHTSHDSTFRRRLFDALAANVVTLQLTASGHEPGTLIPLEPAEQGVHPILNCL